MNILKILKVSTLCCIYIFEVNSTQLSMADKIDMTETITDVRNLEDIRWVSMNEINKNIAANMKNKVIIQDSNTCYERITSWIRIYSTDAEVRKNILSMAENDIKNQLNDKLSIYKDGDLVTIMQKDIKDIFGKDYKVYYNYRGFKYDGQETIEAKRSDGIRYSYKEPFRGTFEELMKKNNNQLVTKIVRPNADFIKDVLNIPMLIITNDKLTYYFNFYNNFIKIYTNLKNAPEIKCDITKTVEKFMNKFKERSQIEQNNVKQKFGEKYYAYYDPIKE